MGTIVDKLNKLKVTKEAIRVAINNKGGTITENDTFTSYATAIDNIRIGDDELTIKQNNINHVKLDDLQYAITYGLKIPNDTVYEICEETCQILYNIITGGLN